MRLGLRQRRVPVREILTARLLPARVELPEVWAGYYRREIATRGIANPRRHRLTLAA